MMKKIINSTILFFALFSVSIQATTVSNLINEGRLKISTELSKKKDIAIGEQVTLKVKLSTERWFVGGTRILAPTIKNAISLKQNKLSTNYTKKINGKVWANQVWEITIYPQKTGDFYIPSIPVEVFVSVSPTEKAIGTILTSPLKFNAIIPSGFIKEDTKWLASNNFEVSQSIKYSNEDLKVGDSVIREIDFKAENTVSMLFPEIEANETEGFKTYLSQNKNNDSSVRGDYKATRKEKITYIIQDSGDLIIPEIELYWWNTEDQTWHDKTLPSIEIYSKHTTISYLNEKKIEILFFIFSLFFVFLLRKKIYDLIKYLLKTDKVQFFKAFIRKDLKNINKLNYKKINKKTNGKTLKQTNTIDKEDLSRWGNLYKIKSKNISRLTILKIRFSI